jgi:hypothetical protein
LLLDVVFLLEMKYPRVVKNFDQGKSLFRLYLKQRRHQVAILFAQAVFEHQFSAIFKLIVYLDLGASKGRSAMAHLVQQDTQRPHIDEVVVRLITDHLRRHVLQGATESIPLL